MVMLVIPPARVQAIRAGLGLSPAELARLLGVEARRVRNWEAHGAPHPDRPPEVVLDVLGELLEASPRDAETARARARRGAEVGFRRLLLELLRAR